MSSQSPRRVCWIFGIAAPVAVVTLLMTGGAPALAAVPQDGGPPLALDRETAQWLVTLPLACVDRPGV